MSKCSRSDDSLCIPMDKLSLELIGLYYFFAITTGMFFLLGVYSDSESYESEEGCLTGLVGYLGGCNSRSPLSSASLFCYLDNC